MMKFLKNLFFCVTLLFFSGGCFAENNGPIDITGQQDDELKMLEEREKEPVHVKQGLDRCIEAYNKVVEDANRVSMAKGEQYPPALYNSISRFVNVCNGNVNFVPDGKTETVYDILFKQYDTQLFAREHSMPSPHIGNIERALELVFEKGGMPFETIKKLKNLFYLRKRKFWEIGGRFASKIEKEISENIKNMLDKRSKNRKLTQFTETPAYFLKAPISNDGKTLLHQAAYHGHEVLFELLVNSFGLDVNILDGDKQTPIYSLFEGASLKDVAGRRKYMEILKFLLEKARPDLNLKDDEGNTIDAYVNRLFEKKKAIYSGLIDENLDETKSIDKKTWQNFEKLWKYFQDKIAGVRKPSFIGEALRLPKSMIEEVRPPELPPEFFEEEEEPSPTEIELPEPMRPVEEVPVKKVEEAPIVGTPKTMEERKKLWEKEKVEARKAWQRKSEMEEEPEEEDLYKFFDF